MTRPPLLCVPVGGSVSTRWLIWKEAWTPAGERWAIDPTANRLDISRSVLIDCAMNMGRPIWQWDSDVAAFNQSYEEQLQLISDCVKRGYHAVVAPHASMSGGVPRVMIQPLHKEDRDNSSPTEPFEIKGGLNSAWYMSLEGLALLKDIGYHTTSDGRRTPMFCTFGLPSAIPDEPDFATTEDFDLAFRFRAEGGKICCDPRLKVAHLAKMDIVVDVDGVRKMREQQELALEAHDRNLRKSFRKEKVED